jgi:hypothetical protein
MVVPIATTMAKDAKDRSILEVATPVITPMSDDDPERKLSNGKETIELDPKGLPLVPQPSRFKDDPLVSIPIFQYSSGSAFPIPRKSSIQPSSIN